MTPLTRDERLERLQAFQAEVEALGLKCVLYDVAHPYPVLDVVIKPAKRDTHVFCMLTADGDVDRFGGGLPSTIMRPESMLDFFRGCAARLAQDLAARLG